MFTAVAFGRQATTTTPPDYHYPGKIVLLAGFFHEVSGLTNLR